MYIVLSGVHGIGKTTLAREVAKRLNAVFITESLDEAIPPPPLGKSSESIKAQLWFMRQMLLKEAQIQDPQKTYVCDRGWMDVYAYSNVVLTEHERSLLSSIMDHLPKRLPDIQLIVDAPISVVEARITRRNRQNADNWNEHDRMYIRRIIGEFRNYHQSFKDLRPIHLLDASGTVSENVDRALALLQPVL